MLKKYTLFTSIAAALLLTVSCASSPKTPQASYDPSKAVLEELPYRMAWAIHGTDNNGEDSTIIIQATIHVGDERLFPLDQEILDYFDGAQRVAGEISSKDYKKVTARIRQRMLESVQESDGRDFYDSLTLRQKKAYLSIMPDLTTAKTYSKFAPWVAYTMASNALVQDSGLTADYSLDTYLLDYGNRQKKYALGLDSIECQLDIITFGDYDTQLIMLKEILDSIIENKTASGIEDKDTDIADLYEAYLANDRDALSVILEDEYDEDLAEYDFYDEYYRLICHDRNERWAVQFDQWLKEGGTTFVYAGSAHFFGDDSVFALMRLQGTLN